MNRPLEVHRHCGAGRRQLRRLLLEDRGDDLGPGVAAEGAVARDHLVEHAAEGEDVRTVVGGLALAAQYWAAGRLAAEMAAAGATVPQAVPMGLKRVWRFDCDPSAPKEDVHKYQDNRVKRKCLFIRSKVA